MAARKSGSQLPSAAGATLLIRNARLVDAATDSPGSVFIRNGIIESVCLGPEAARRDLPADAEDVEIYDAGGAVLMPSFVDLHAHFRDPGYTEKEDLLSASRAAVAGGYGTVVLMANTKPVISTRSAAVAIRGRAAESGLLDVFQTVSLTRDFNGTDISALEELDSADVPMATEDGREVASASVMLRAMEICARKGVIVSCHCEDPDLAQAARPFRETALRLGLPSGVSAGSASGSSRFDLSSRFASLTGSADFEPVRSNLSQANRLLRLAEDTMTVRNLELAAAASCRVHIAHISTVGSLEAVRKAKAVRPQMVTCEATPHHLALNDLIPAIVNPPLRSEVDRLALVEALSDGTIDAIATDHAPHTAADKEAGAPGFSGIQLSFALCHTVLVRTGRISLSRLSALLSANPAKILGLARGLLKPDYAADLVLVEPDTDWVVAPQNASRWFSRGKNTPLAGERLSGKICVTFRRGVKVYQAD